MWGIERESEKTMREGKRESEGEKERMCASDKVNMRDWERDYMRE